jgi:hypothetical protein
VQGGTNGGCPYTDQNVWSPISGETQTLNVNNPGDWEIVSTTPVNPSGSVTTFPNTGAPFNEQPLSGFSSVTSSFTETMPHNAGTSGWAMYDLWFDNWAYEVMVQHDFTNNGPCDYAAVAVFGGQTWGLCVFGSTFAWKLAPSGATRGSSATINESSGSVDIKAMIGWLVAHGYMPPNPTITNLSYGWEICSTGGVTEHFRVSSFSLTAT